MEASSFSASLESQRQEDDPELQTLIDERRSIPSGDTQERTKISKQIRQEIRRIKEEQRSSKINGILSSFSNIRQIKIIKGRKKADLTIGMQDVKGNLQTDRASIAEVFAQFYEDLYRSTAANGSTTDVPPFTASELHDALKRLKSGKAPEGRGLVAEMLKGSGA